MTTTTTQPVPPTAQILDDMDAALVGLIAMAAFGPCEQGTATSVEQASTAEVLLFRLKLARRGVAEMREALELPARQVPLNRARVSDDTASVPDGLGPIPSVAAEKERTPRSAAPGATAARGSTGAVVAPGAGADVRVRAYPDQEGGRADGAVGAATFDLPAQVTVPSFDNGPRFAEGEHRLVGAVTEPVLIPQLVGVAAYVAQRRKQLRNP